MLVDAYKVLDRFVMRFVLDIEEIDDGVDLDQPIHLLEVSFVDLEVTREVKKVQLYLLADYSCVGDDFCRRV